MLKTKMAVAAAIIGSLATAAHAGGSLGVGYVFDSNLEVEDDFGRGKVDGDGFMLQGAVDLTESVFLFGDYFTRDFDDIGGSFEWNTMRLGLGYAFEGVPIWIGAGYEQVEIDLGGGFSDDIDGIAARVGTRLPMNERIAFVGELGAAALDDATSADLMLGFALAVNDQFSLTADYRLTLYVPDDDPNDTEITLDDITVGVRVDF